MSKVEPFRAHHFDDVEQQHEASWIGMWVFLATEVMFFGGMFTGYFVYRQWYLQAFASASNHLDVWLGGINTAVLICSSFTMALAVHSAETDKRKPLIIFLLLTIVLGLAFLGIKFFEYYTKFEEHLVPGSAFRFEESLANPAEIFFSFYFAMTGMHAVHMLIGIGLLTTLVFQARRGRFSALYNTPVELTGLYWHFVDIVWIFLFPLLYLLGRHL
ncbi:MAG TPA: cytochrome c oxidase subunit 3 family protein [Candidatus Binatia bacterium]|nr:cytochrome c oxidase subunit 3 family protein [Candidatus Binatia bacterium]